MTGTIAVIGGLSFLGRPVPLGISGAALLAGAAMLALVGGLVMARAYHDASKRI